MGSSALRNWETCFTTNSYQVLEAGPMPTGCNREQLEFEGFDGRKVIATFDGGAITCDTGALLLRQTEKAIGLFVSAHFCAPFSLECFAA